MTAGNYYSDEQARFIPEPSGYYGTYPDQAFVAREQSMYRNINNKIDHYARPQMTMKTTTSLVNSETSEYSSCSSIVEAIVRPCVAEFIAVFVAVFIFNHLESELTERHVTAMHKIIILAMSDAVSTALFVSAFKTVHLNPSLTISQLFSLSTSWFLCILIISVQTVASTCAVAANAYLRQISPGLASVQHDITTDWTRAAYILMISQLIGTILVVSAHLLCMSSKPIGPFRVGHLSQSALCLFLSVLLSSFLSLLQSNINWNPLQACALSLYRAFSQSSQDAFPHHYIFWVGPVIGSLIACAMYRLLFASSDRRIALRCCSSEDDVC